jgi:hypothetical protein
MILELEPFLILVQHEEFVQFLPLELQLVLAVLELTIISGFGIKVHQSNQLLKKKSEER